MSRTGCSDRPGPLPGLGLVVPLDGTSLCPGHFFRAGVTENGENRELHGVVVLDYFSHSLVNTSVVLSRVKRPVYARELVVQRVYFFRQLVRERGDLAGRILA